MSDSGGIYLWIGQHLLFTTILAALVLLVCRLMSPSPAIRHGLWLLVLCRLMIPPFSDWSWSVPIAISSPQAPQVLDVKGIVANTPSRPPVVSLTDAVGVMDPSVSEALAAREAKVSQGEHPVPASWSSRASGAMLSAWFPIGIWSAGSALVAILLLNRVRRVRRLLRGSSTAKPWIERDVADWSEQLSIEPPPCVVSDRVRSPFLWCVGRLQLVWPSAESHPEHRVRSQPILLHELAHLKRRDHWTAWVEVLAMVAWWWNPVFWFVRRSLRTSAEMACDAWVVRLMPDQRRTYAESLVEFTSRGPTAHLAVGATTGCKRTFTRRLEMIMHEDYAARIPKSAFISLALVAALSLPVFGIDLGGQRENGAGKTSEASSPVVTVTAASESAVKAQGAANAASLAVSKQDNATSEASAASPGVETSASLKEVLDHIEKRYYGQVDRNELERAAIEAILSKLDDKSSLLTREEYEEMTVHVDGDLVGVGIAIHLDSDSGQLVVTRPIRNSPGLAAGIRRDDVIVSIDGEPTQGLKLRQLVNRIRGLRGTPVTLGIQRAGETLDLTVVRDRFEMMLVHPLSTSADGRDNYWADRAAGIGYVHMPAFTKHTVSQLGKVLAELRNQGMKRLVLDLRDCSGGLLTAATGVVDLFIDEGIILSSQGRRDHEMTIRATAGGGYTDLPLVVVVNRLTASAAEIVAAALQDHGRAAIVGEQTFGRGTVQALFRLENGGALRLTTAAWLRPNGKTLLRREGSDDWGVHPDPGLAVTTTEEARKQLAHQRQQLLNGVAVENADPQLKKAVDALRNR